MNAVHIATDRNILRKLLQFVDPNQRGNEGVLESFTIQLEYAGDTTLLMRRDEAVTHETIGPHDFRGFGHEFENTYTKNKIKNSTGHHRIISYEFCQLKLVVRHETDGYVGPRTKAMDMTGAGSLSSMLDSMSISDQLKEMTESSAAPTIAKPTSAATMLASKLRVLKQGWAIDLESTLEIKTRTVYRPLQLRDVAAQLWLSQTPKLVIAHHKKGVFKHPVVKDVAAEVKQWEGANQTALRRLGMLLVKMNNLMREHRIHAVAKYDQKDDKLVIYEAREPKMLPDDLYAMWKDE